jgi:hypothetical protein
MSFHLPRFEKVRIDQQNISQEVKKVIHNGVDLTGFPVRISEKGNMHRLWNIPADTYDALIDRENKILEEEAEAEKQAGMNVMHRTFYKTIQKPVGDWWNKHFKKEPKSLEMPKQHLPFIWYD